jgi:hypothetical protein
MALIQPGTSMGILYPTKSGNVGCTVMPLLSPMETDVGTPAGLFQFVPPLDCAETISQPSTQFPNSIAAIPAKASAGIQQLAAYYLFPDESGGIILTPGTPIPIPACFSLPANPYGSITGPTGATGPTGPTGPTGA